MNIPQSKIKIDFGSIKNTCYSYSLRQHMQTIFELILIPVVATLGDTYYLFHMTIIPVIIHAHVCGYVFVCPSNYLSMQTIPC